MSGGAAATTPWQFHAAFWRCRAASKATGETIPIAECRRVVLYSSIQAATLARAADRVEKSSRERSSNSRVECQASMAALSSAEPGRPIDWEMPSRVQAARTRPAVYSADSTGDRNASTVRSCDARARAASAGCGGPGADAVARSPARGATGGAAAVLGGDRARVAERGRRGGGWRLAGGGHAVVPSSWWHAADRSKRPVGALPVLSRARGDRDLAGTRMRRAGHRPASGPLGFDDLAEAAAQCRDPRRVP